MVLLKGAEVSAKIQKEVERQLEAMDGYVPVLAVVRVGERPDDLSYEKSALSRMKKFGMKGISFAFPEDVSMEKFRKEFARINEAPEIDGILLLRPLPAQLDEKEIERMICPEKDLDGICPENIAKVFAGDETGFAPCTAEAVIRLLKAYEIPMEGKRAVIVGRSMVVGRPLSMLLLKENATVTVCHTRTKNLKEICRQGEILVAAAGRARMLGGEFVGEGAVAVDVGINVDENGTLCGDMDLDSVEKKASMATPVPGGIGAVTTAVLAEHLVRAAAGRSKRNAV